MMNAEPDTNGELRIANGQIESDSFAPLATVGGLSPRVIDLREFPIRKWYYANPLWYYHQPGTFHRVQADSKFLDQVDPLLKDLCALLLQSDLCTTPSCQGHFYPHGHFVAVWNELCKEANLIQTEGLIVRDCETDEALVFAEPEYQLPWTDENEFYAEAEPAQSCGYLGFVVPPERQLLVERLCKEAFACPALTLDLDQDLSQIIGSPLFAILVRPRTLEERDHAWNEVTNYIRGVLSEPIP